MPDRVHAPSIRVEADRPAGDLDRSLGLTRPVEVDRQRTAVDLLTRRLTASVLLIEALGGGWDRSSLPERPECCGKLANTSGSK